MKCKNCGANLDHNYCEYCGTFYGEELRGMRMDLLDLGWDVIVFVPSKEEDSDRITCGNALITQGDSLDEN